MKSAYSLPHGDYIGNAKTAFRLNKKYGINWWEKRTEQSNVVSIGWSPKRQKWYGWSHRAIYGFKPGDVVKEGDVTQESLPVGFEAQDYHDAKIMAEAFAEGVA
jgi:hypothetical protein